MSSWLLTFWHACLTGAVLSAIILIGFIATLPTSYTPYKTASIYEEDFSEHDKINKNSGYAYFSKHRGTNKYLRPETSVAVLVLGDIGHSPRMQYHTTSIAAHGGKVDLIGYIESDVIPDIKSSTLIDLVPLAPVPARFRTSSRASFPIIGSLKVLFQAWSLYYTLCYKTEATKYMLVQNPPSIPTLFVAVLVCRLRNTNLIIDWHNLGHTLLALKLGKSHPMVHLSELYERSVARLAYGHFAVSQAMATVLKQRYGIEATPLHDRPASHFQPISASERSKVLRRLPQTSKHVHNIEKGETRLLVSSTSWTADEDFSILLDALKAYSATVSMNERFPKILAIITGKGPMKAAYEVRIAELQKGKKLTKAHVHTAWLSVDDYAALLGVADLGVSLHQSSSGVDLPMKVVDMFGCGLPVVGWDAFESWSELVQEGTNGKGFRDAAGLERLLEELFDPRRSDLDRLKLGAMKECQRRWKDEWTVPGKTMFGIRSQEDRKADD